MSRTLLVIDDDEASCRLVRATFKAEGIEVLAAHDGPAGMARIEADHPDIVLLDVKLPTGSGVEVLERLKATHPSLPVVMLTASRDVKTAVRATQLGAFDYLTKPIEHDEIVAVVRRALEARALHLEVEDLRRRVNRNDSRPAGTRDGSKRAIKEVLEQVALVAASTFSVLIVGETGSGKELVARAIHRQSERRRQAFIALDCGAIPEPLVESELFGHERGAFTGADRRRAGHFRLATGGTCFLDEIGNLPTSLQAKLLRVLESREVGRSAATARRLSMSGSSRPPTTTCRRALVTAASGRISTSAWRSTRLPSRRCERGGRTSRTSHSASWMKRASSCAARCNSSRPRRSTSCSGPSGRATCASCATSSDRRCCARTALAIRPSDLRALLTTAPTPPGAPSRCRNPVLERGGRGSQSGG